MGFIMAGIPGDQTREPEPEAVPIRDYGWTPEIGDHRSFVPAAFIQEHAAALPGIRPDLDTRVEGTVIFVNQAHRWCRVQWTAPDGSKQCECFKF